MSQDDAELVATAEALAQLKAELGSGYWSDARVIALQESLRRLLGRAGAWAPEGLPLHQRARRAARLEHTYARLLWPGGADD